MFINQNIVNRNLYPLVLIGVLVGALLTLGGIWAYNMFTSPSPKQEKGPLAQEQLDIGNGEVSEFPDIAEEEEKTVSAISFQDSATVLFTYPSNWDMYEYFKTKAGTSEIISIKPQANRLQEDVRIEIAVTPLGHYDDPYFDSVNFFGKPGLEVKRETLGKNTYHWQEERFEGVRTVKYLSASDSFVSSLSLAIAGGRQKMDFYLPDDEIAQELGVFRNVIASFQFRNGNETTKWKTYRNEEYGFEVKYPPSWTATIGAFPLVSFTPRIFINVFQNQQQLPLAQWVQQERGALVSKMTPITINGIPALRGKESGLVGYDSIYFGKGAVIINLSSQEDSQDTEAFETMLTTFEL